MEFQNKPLPRINWDLGAAYDLFISLAVLHQPDRFGLRPSWAAGVRSRLAVEDRKTLEQADRLFPAPLHWIYTLPGPKDAGTVLGQLRQMPAAQRLPALAVYAGSDPDLVEVFQRVSAQGAWQEADLEALRDAYRRERHELLRPADLEEMLEIWMQPEEFGEAYLAALQAYTQAFFAEEEQRILPALQDGLAQAQEMARQMALPDLFEQLSQGVSIPDLLDRDELVFIPSFWGTPLIFVRKLAPRQALLTFGVRPADASLVPGELVPDALLQTLKAMADPTRLRILRYLALEPVTPTELARRLRLRAPTVTHHLNALRLAGLVHITLGAGDERHYATRPEAVAGLQKQLKAYLANGTDEAKE